MGCLAGCGCRCQPVWQRPPCSCGGHKGLEGGSSSLRLWAGGRHCPPRRRLASRAVVGGCATGKQVEGPLAGAAAGSRAESCGNWHQQFVPASSNAGNHGGSKGLAAACAIWQLQRCSWHSSRAAATEPLGGRLCTVPRRLAGKAAAGRRHWRSSRCCVGGPRAAIPCGRLWWEGLQHGWLRGTQLQVQQCWRHNGVALGARSGSCCGCSGRCVGASQQLLPWWCGEQSCNRRRTCCSCCRCCLGRLALVELALVGRAVQGGAPLLQLVQQHKASGCGRLILVARRARSQRSGGGLLRWRPRPTVSCGRAHGPVRQLRQCGGGAALDSALQACRRPCGPHAISGHWHAAARAFARMEKVPAPPTTHPPPPARTSTTSIQPQLFGSIASGTPMPWAPCRPAGKGAGVGRARMA